MICVSISRHKSNNTKIDFILFFYFLENNKIILQSLII